MNRYTVEVMTVHRTYYIIEAESPEIAGFRAQQGEEPIDYTKLVTRQLSKVTELPPLGIPLSLSTGIKS